MNLWRYVKSIGMRPMVAGNIKGFHNVHRNPETQRSFAEATKQNPHMVTSFCDGTKVSFENVVVANATGARIHKRGMIGGTYNGDVENVKDLYDLELIQSHPTGIVDYTIGPNPNAGVYVVAFSDDPHQQHYMKYYKQGTGPLYVFYTPYHLCHMEVPLTLLRAAVLKSAVCAPMGKPIGHVVTISKVALAPGDVLDDIGGFKYYGVAEDADETLRQNLLPVGLAKGAILRNTVAMDHPLTFDDVELPTGRMSDELWGLQNQIFGMPRACKAEANNNVDGCASPVPQKVHCISPSDRKILNEIQEKQIQ